MLATEHSNGGIPHSFSQNNLVDQGNNGLGHAHYFSHTHAHTHTPRHICTHHTYYTSLTVVQRDHVQGIEQLSLVLVDALHLAIEHGIRIDLDIISRLQILGKLVLVLL